MKKCYNSSQLEGLVLIDQIRMRGRLQPLPDYKWLNKSFWSKEALYIFSFSHHLKWYNHHEILTLFQMIDWMNISNGFTNLRKQP